MSRLWPSVSGHSFAPGSSSSKALSDTPIVGADMATMYPYYGVYERYDWYPATGHSARLFSGKAAETVGSLDV